MSTVPGNVVFVITHLGVGGAQETVLALARGLSRRGAGVTVVCGPPVDGDHLHGEFESAGINVVVLPALRRSVDPLVEFKALVALVRTLRALRPDVVHTHSSKAGVIGRLAARFVRRTLVVHSVHGWSFAGLDGTKRRLAVQLERLLSHWTDALITVNERDRSIGISHSIGAPERYRVIRSAIDLSSFRQAARDVRSSKVVGVVMRLAAPKQPLLLIEAFAGLHQSNPDAELRIVGDGPLRDEVSEAVNALGLGGFVKMLGSRRDIALLMSGFDVLAFASAHEGLPRVIVEALAAGVPVVSNDVGAVAEVVTPDNGLLVPTLDAGVFASALQRVLTERPPFVNTDLDEFDNDVMVQRHLDLYGSLGKGGRFDE